MVSSNIILILLYLSPFYRTYYKATIKTSISVKRGYYKARNTHLSEDCIAFAMSHSVDWATFDDSWHNITLNSGIAVGNTNFTHSNNRWRYENGGRDIRIQLNVGNSNGTQVPAGQSKNFASPSQFSFMPSGKFMRLCGSGQASALVWVEINTTSSPFARFAPVTGASSYCALDVLIPKP